MSTENKDQKPKYILTGLLSLCILKEYMQTPQKLTVELYIMALMMDMVLVQHLLSQSVSQKHQDGQFIPD